MFNNASFRKFWKDNLSTICLNVLTVDEKKIDWNPWGKSDATFFLGGLLLNGEEAHLTITPKGDEFVYFHFTLARPEVYFVQNAQIRCDHVFFELHHPNGSIKVTESMMDGNGKKSSAKSKTGLTHNYSLLADKIKEDLEKIMSCFSAHHNVGGVWE
ncbi:MAG: hypothetical protein V4754_08045 [Pseudomonadota bacterium]